MTTTRATVSLAEVERAIVEGMTAADDRGRNWHYVRVATDGSVYAGEEVSECVPESEYYGRRPHPVTVWAEQSNSSSTPGDGLRYWDDCEPGSADYWAAEDAKGNRYGVDWTDDPEEHPHCTRPFVLGDWVDMDLSETMREVREELEACDWLEVE